MVRVLFVCMGNFCRSPTAQGVFLRVLEQHALTSHVEVESAGTHAYHVGEAPDPRSQAASLRRGIDLSGLRGRRIQPQDFVRCDYILAMDKQNLLALQQMCPPEHAHKLRLLLDFAPELGLREVPDPYYGGPKGFEHVMDLIEAACEGLLQHIRRHHLP